MHLVQSHPSTGLLINFVRNFYAISAVLQHGNNEQHQFFKLSQVNSFHGLLLNPFLLNKYSANVKTSILTRFSSCQRQMANETSAIDTILFETGIAPIDRTPKPVKINHGYYPDPAQPFPISRVY